VALDDMTTPSPDERPHLRRHGDVVSLDNGLLRLECDTRTEFPFYNRVSIAESVGRPFRTYCHWGCEAMPEPSELVAPSEDGEPQESPKETVWLMGHDYRVKAHEHDNERLVAMITYSPPMVVVGELSALGGGNDLRGFPDWGDAYWDRVETVQASVQIFATLEAGARWIDFAPRTALGKLVAIAPMLLHGAAGHDDVPPYLALVDPAGAVQFLTAQGPDGAWPTHHELIEQGIPLQVQQPWANRRALVLFSERPDGVTVVMGLHKATPDAWLLLGRNVCGADPSHPEAAFAAAAATAPHLPRTFHHRGFTEQTCLLPADQHRAITPVRIGFYPKAPLPYGQADAIRAFLNARPEWNILT